MKASNKKLFLLIPTLLLTSCGYGLKEVYDGVPYNSPVFEENYFDVWHDKINPSHKKYSVNKIEEEHTIGEDDLPFTSLEDENFKLLDPNFINYEYTYDIVKPEGDKKAYGPSVKLSGYDNSFKYGVSSKLFDGQMFCNGHYQNARTQIRPASENSHGGFGLLFAKECSNASYFMMNFKCSLITDKNQNLGYVESNIKFKISFYLRNGDGYTQVPLYYSINNVPTNSGDDHFLPPFAQREDMYVCLGFNLKNNAYIPTSRLCGISIEYELLSDTYSPSHPDENISHAVMLYEISFPYTSWN